MTALEASARATPRSGGGRTSLEDLDGAVDRLHRLGLDVPRHRPDGRDDPAAARRGLRASSMVGADPAADPRVAQRRLGAGGPTRAELLSAGFVGLMLPGANAVISVAEKTVPSGLAALLVASIPLWVDPAAPRVTASASPRAASSPCSSASAASCCSLHPSGEATIIGLLACIGAAFMWAVGSFASPRISLPRDPLVSTAWQSPARRARRSSASAWSAARRATSTSASSPAARSSA